MNQLQRIYVKNIKHLEIKVSATGPESFLSLQGFKELKCHHEESASLTRQRSNTESVGEDESVPFICLLQCISFQELI